MYFGVVVHGASHQSLVDKSLKFVEHDNVICRHLVTNAIKTEKPMGVIFLFKNTMQLLCAIKTYGQKWRKFFVVYYLVNIAMKEERRRRLFAVARTTARNCSGSSRAAMR